MYVISVFFLDLHQAPIDNAAEYENFMKISVPFDYPNYINGAHPLVDGFSTIEHASYEFSRITKTPVRGYASVNSEIRCFSDQLLHLCTSLSAEPEIYWKMAYDFITSRKPGMNQAIPDISDVIYFHTVPYSLNNKKFILHIESISQIFQPFISQGTPSPCPLTQHFAYHFIKYLLESSNCLQIFTNIEFTVRQLKRVFGSDAINAKIRYIPPSSRLNFDVRNQIRSIKKSNKTTDLNILFTNSYHDVPDSFYLRGGMDLIYATLDLSKYFKNISITIRSSIPDDLKRTEIWNLISNSQNINWIHERVTDERLVDLYASADLFYLHSNSLHSLSILRGMSLGVTCLVSDVPGVSEYIQDGYNGIQLRGQRDVICKEDPVSGWVYDDYSSFLITKFSKGPNYESIKDFIATAAQSKEHLYYLSENAKSTIDVSFAEENSNASFICMLDEINC